MYVWALVATSRGGTAGAPVLGDSALDLSSDVGVGGDQVPS